MRPLFLLLCALALALAGCSTPPKTWTAPDATKVNASAKRLSAAVKKASETQARAEAKVADAEQSHARVSAIARTVADKVNELLKVVPPELRPEVEELKATVEAQAVEQTKGAEFIAEAKKEIAQLKTDLAEATAAKIELQTNQTKYQADALKTANDCTEERRLRIVAEAQLSKEKWIRIFWKLGGSVAVLGVIALFVLWFLGKWTIKGALAYVGVRT